MAAYSLNSYLSKVSQAWQVGDGDLLATLLSFQVGTGQTVATKTNFAS